ncbi:hypothetical protein [Companilactobacillus furfuricola]|uniref:hypothetical protein n=1 Tax=Companilactobacillus furfuricola TaxID=1462575 RepID=UPI000F79113C|nr:hypothetical protein [Companilactobacillus furfuricola]
MRAYTDREVINGLRKAINDDQPFTFISTVKDQDAVTCYEGNDSCDILPKLLAIQLVSHQIETHQIETHQLNIEVDDIDLEYLCAELGTLIDDCLTKAAEDKIKNDLVEKMNIKTPNMEESESIPVKGQFSDLPEEFKQMIIYKILNEVSDMRGTDND